MKALLVLGIVAARQGGPRHPALFFVHLLHDLAAGPSPPRLATWEPLDVAQYRNDVFVTGDHVALEPFVEPDGRFVS